MAKFVKFNQVMTERASYDDELDTPPAPVVVSQPVSVNTDLIRSFGPRKDSKPGTLLIFTNASMFSVTETYDQVDRLVNLPSSKQPGRGSTVASSTNAAEPE